MAQRPEPRSRTGVVFDATSIALFAGGWVALACGLAAATGVAQTGAMLVLLALPGLLSAEFGAALFHWWADTFWTPSAPWIGPTVIRSFREHHVDPGAIAQRSAAEVSGQNCFACLPLLAIGATVEPATGFGAAFVSWLLLFTLGIALTNLFHQWAHSTQVPGPVAALQRRGWILSPEHHALHHSGQHDRAYCVTTGWLDPLLDGVRFFPRLERAIRRLGRRGGRELAKGPRAH